MPWPSGGSTSWLWRRLVLRFASSNSLRRRIHGLQTRVILSWTSVRMPGGFSTPAQVEYLNSQTLTVVNGTAYPGDADVCKCLGAKVLGRCAARLANNGDGRIVILHDDKRLLAKLESCLDQLELQQKHAVTLSELFGTMRVSTEHVMRMSRDTALAPLFVPL